MRKKVTITIEGGLALAQSIVEGISMDIKPKSGNKWSGSKMIEFSPPFIEMRCVIKGPELAKAEVKTKINGIEKSFTTYSKSSRMFTYDGRDYIPSDFNL